MRLTSVILISFIFTFSSFSQDYTLESPLDNTVSETSGLIFLDNILITHNDSGNSNELYEINTSTGDITRTVTITNSTNVDWEDLTYDNNYIYIGDFGNFDATRTNLRIYRISRNDYINSNSVTADVINFSYNEQTDFSVQEFTTNFDAEALIHYNNNLYVFTKNWADGNTNVYTLPKTPGTYSITAIDVLNTQGLVTGATTSVDGSSIVLCGYDLNGSFLINLNGFSSGLFSNGSLTKTSINPPNSYSFQTEGIAPINNNEYYVSAEAGNGNSQGLYSFNLSTLSTEDSQPNRDVDFYPNPAKNFVQLNSEEYLASIYTVAGQLIKSFATSKLDISDINSGLYILRLTPKSKVGEPLTHTFIIKGN